MTIQQMVALFPKDERQKILEGNHIALAQPVRGNYSMEILLIMWKAYVEKDIKMDCGACIGRVLKMYRAMQLDMVKMTFEDNLLSEV